MPDDVVPRRTRRLVRCFLLAFAICGVATFEVWPFTGFRLFSEVRHAERKGWSIAAVDELGDERRIDLAGLPVAFRNTSQLIGDFDELSARERDEVCDAWVQPMRDDGRRIAQVRIYRVVDSVRPDGPPPRRSLAYECGTRR